MTSFSQSIRREQPVIKYIMERINRRSIFLAACLFLLLFFGLVLTDGLVALGRIHPGVKIGDVNVGGLTPAQACKKLDSKLNPALGEPVNVVYQSKKWEILPSQFDVQVSVKKSVDKAYAIGREEGLIGRIKQRFSCWMEPKRSPLIYSIDNKLVSGFIDQMATEIDKDPVDAGISLNNGGPKITPSQIGIKLNKPQMFSFIKTKLVSSNNRSIEASVTMLPVDITEDNAQNALKDTKEMIRSPLTINYEQKMWQIDSEQIGQLLRFKKAPKTKSNRELELKAELNPDKVKEYIGELTEDLNLEPKNAEFQVDGPSVTIIPSENGLIADTNAALAKMKKAVSSHPPRQIFLSTKVVEPERTTEEAEAMGIKERISSFSTTFSSGNAPRVNNIRLLAQALDGTIVAPGKVFSFNETTGQRTAEKGYQEAPAIVQGELVPSIGGGICQVATTLFNTVFLGGYPVVSRQNHSFYISHYPAGRDATVAWGGPDFKFKNDTDSYILIKTWPSSGSIAVAIYGTNFGTEVSYKATEFTNFKPFPTKKVEDPALPKGQEVVDTGGIEGRDITVNRTVKRNGKVITEDKFFSRYKPRSQTIRVGTMEPVPPPAAPAVAETQTAQ